MPLDKKAMRFKAKIFKALADPVRLEIIEFLRSPKKFQRLGGRIPRGVLLIGLSLIHI